MKKGTSNAKCADEIIMKKPSGCHADKENDPPVSKSQVDMEVDSDGFSKSDSQDNFEALVSQIQSQAVVKKKEDLDEEPPVIEPDDMKVNSDGFWESSNSGEFDKLASQAISQASCKNVLKEKNVDEKAKLPVKGGTKKEETNTKSRSIVKARKKQGLKSDAGGKKTETTSKSEATQDKKKVKKRVIEYEPKKKVRKLPECSDSLEKFFEADSDDNQVPSIEAEKILFGERGKEEMDSCEIIKEAKFSSHVEFDDKNDNEFDAREVEQSTQCKENDGGEVQSLSQEMEKRIVFEPENVSKTSSILKSVNRQESEKSTSSKPSSSRVAWAQENSQAAGPSNAPSSKAGPSKVKPVKLFGTDPDQPLFGYLEEDDRPLDPYFQFGNKTEYNHVISDDEYDDQDILLPEEKDSRDSDGDDFSEKYLKIKKSENDRKKAECSGSSGKKSSVKKNSRSSLKRGAENEEKSGVSWGPTQEVLTQGGTKRSIKLGIKTKGNIGKQGKYAADQKHSVKL